MTKPTFDPARRMVMAQFRTVNGFNLQAGTPLLLVEEPKARGEVDEAMAKRLWNSGIASYADQHRPTPVETPEQEKSRLALEALRDAGDGEVTLPDLLVWQQDDSATGAKAGDKVTKDDLTVIAERESVIVAPGDTKAVLIRKITEERAARLNLNTTNSGSAVGPTVGADGFTGGTATLGGTGADTGLGGDAHGSAGEGPTD